MRIKISPENDIEKQRIKEIVHTGVEEFFIFGNKKDDDGKFEDYHDWKGGYRYLIGSLHYFLNQITEEQNAKNREKHAPEMDIKPSAFQPHMIKKGDVGDIQVINTKEIEVGKEGEDKTLKFPKHPLIIDESELQTSPSENDSKMDD